MSGEIRSSTFLLQKEQTMTTETAIRLITTANPSLSEESAREHLAEIVRHPEEERKLPAICVMEFGVKFEDTVMALLDG